MLNDKSDLLRMSTKEKAEILKTAFFCNIILQISSVLYEVLL